MKKAIILTTILAAVLCISGNLWAGTYSGGNGTAETPYLISTVDDWQELMDTSGDWYRKYFSLIADLDLASMSVVPVGNTSISFAGVFNGNGHVIRNAVINMPTSDDVGLFGKVGVTGALFEIGVKNVGVESIHVTGHSKVGGLVGEYISNKITNCYVKGTVTGSSCVGGLIGLGRMSVTNCYSTSTVIGTSNALNIGGLMGGNAALGNTGGVLACYATGPVSSGSNSSRIGGLIGYNGGQVEECYSTGSVDGGSNSTEIGGLFGYCSAPSQIVKHCFATGFVENAPSSIYHIGGLIGTQYYQSTNSCLWDTETSGTDTGVAYGWSAGVTGKTTAEMKTLTTFTASAWDFLGETVNGNNDYWRMCQNGQDYPHFAWEYISQGDFICPDGVGIEDLARIADDWLLRRSPLYGADASADGIVDLVDFGIMSANWSQ